MPWRRPRVALWRPAGSWSSGERPRLLAACAAKKPRPCDPPAMTRAAESREAKVAELGARLAKLPQDRQEQLEQDLCKGGRR